MKTKKLAYFLVLLLACACAKQQLEEREDPSQVTVLRADLTSLSKTAIDGVKINWTEGDAICVNGKNSSALSEDAASAEFSFNGVLTLPFKAIYPTALYKGASTIQLPSVWNPFEVPLYGYASGGNSISFKSLTCLIKLSVTSESKTTLSSVILKSLGGEQVSGDFAIDYATGILTATSSDEADQMLRVIVGKALSEIPVTVYIPVPAGEYASGYEIELVSGENKSMTCKVDARTLSAGELRIMPEVSFVPDGETEIIGGIRNAADFLDFAAAVNAGKSTVAWENEEGWVTLLDDIDFSGVTSWTPAGNATAPWTSYNPSLPDGEHAFTGKFDGNAHHIKNLVLTDDESVAGRHFGIFGYVGAGGIVQNFVIEDNCSLTVTSSVSHSAGLVAGVLYDATVRDVTSYAPMTYSGSVGGYFHMALVGGAYASAEGCTIDSVHNYGAINATNSANLNAGATALHVAGIVGFTNASDEKSVVVSSSNNYGEITSQAGRTAGIVGAANKNTGIIGCENHGNQLNTMPKSDGGRLGNITCYTSSGSYITECKNYGNLVSTTGARVGGIVSLPSGGIYTGNENYGEIISDSSYRGVFFGYVASSTTWTGGKASGRVGSYNGGEYVYDVYPEASVEKYLGPVGSTGSISASGIVYDIATGETPVNPDPDLDVEADFRIFFIGNSFTKDAVEHLPGILAAAGLDKIQMVHMYYGGRTVPEYNSGWSTSSDYHCYVCNPGQTGWTDISGKNLATIAATGKWDVVTIQEHTGRQLAWSWTDDEKAAVQGLIDKVNTAQTATGGSPKIYYILSQAYHNISKAQSGDKPFTNTDSMWEIISAQGKKVMEECTFDGIISTGAMLQNLRTTALNNSNGLSRDGYHMDYGISRYGAACAVFETVIGPFNGDVKLDDNSYRTTTESTTDGSWTTAVTDERAPIALAAARAAIEKPFEVTDLSSLTPSTDPAEVSISSASDLLDFASKVNSGEASYLKAKVTLTADIDCSSITSWTPIGDCTLGSWTTSTLAPSGNIFTGTFDGGGHSISNMAMSFAPSSAAKAWGFFACLGTGAVVKNLTFASSCSMAISTGVSGVFGTLAGLVFDATVENVTSNAAITGGGTSSLANNTVDGRVAVGGVIGWAMASTGEITLSNLTNNGPIGSTSADFVRGNNAGNGANGFMVGGVVGFSSNCGNTYAQNLTCLVNTADIYTDAGRVSGVLSSANRYTIMSNCSNSGNVRYSGSGTFRLGNITCIAGGGTVLSGCTNTGNLIAENCSSAAGVVCLINGANVSVDSCSSLGATIVAQGFDVSTPKATYSGALFGYCNYAATFSGCKVSGYVGTSSSGAVALTAENYLSLSGQATSKCTTATAENITLEQ